MSAQTRVGVLLGRLLRTYQLAMEGRPSPCRFQPSCSEYARQAIERHGPTRGSWLAVRRLFRCHPWGGLGFDPVPTGTRPAETRSAETREPAGV